MIEIDQLIQSYKDDPEVEFSGPQSEESINLLEQSLNLLMSPSYRDFLKRYGSAWLFGTGINGIRDNQPFMPSEGCVYYDTIRTRNENGLPNFLIVIYRDSDTDAVVCLDSSSPDESGEYPVVAFDIDSKRIFRWARNFNDYFLYKWRALSQNA